MLNIFNNFDEVKNSNLVILLKNRFDLEKYNFLALEKNIIDNIEKIIEEQKNTTFEFFLGNDKFKKVIIFFYLDKKEDILLFLGENIQKLPENITFEYQKDNILLDSIILGKYEYDKFKEKKSNLDLNIILNDIDNFFLQERLSTLKNITDARDLVNLPSNEKTCDKYIRHIKNIKFRNSKVKVIDYDELKRGGFGLIEAVGRASTSKPKIVIIEKIIDKKLPTIGLVGKGIVFDTGGLNIKTGNEMYGMKEDMAGSATLLYTMKEIDEKNLGVNVVCALCIAENSIAGDAFRPGDILKSYSGLTVEVINTDAEGRLVLADGIGYLSKNYNLEKIVSVATLTGACMMAVGYNYAGVMGYDKDFISKLINNQTFEKYWELPFEEQYIKKTKGEISDLKNLTEGMFVGASLGGAFLYNFCQNKEDFTHIDIAGVSFVKEKYGLYNIGATGFGVDSLSKIILNLKLDNV